jgi:hypothetical protein
MHKFSGASTHLDVSDGDKLGCFSPNFGGRLAGGFASATSLQQG